MPDSRKNHSLRARVALLGLAVLAGAGCGGAKTDSLEQNVRVVDLIANLSKGKVEVEGIGKVAKTSFQVGGEEREVLFMHPPSRVTYPPVRMTLESRLDLSLGINQKAWGEAGDGVQFSVYARPSRGEKVRIFSTYIDPKHVERDRRWADAVVTLGIYAGQEVAITLETDGGPAKDLGWDWSGWSRATLTIEKE